MKIFFARLTLVLWFLTILISMTLIIAGIFDTDMGAFEAGISLFIFMSLVTAVLSFLTLGIIDPRRVMTLLKQNK